MKTLRILLAAAILSVLGACEEKTPELPNDAVVLHSPDTQLELKFSLVNGVPQYSLTRAGEAVILPSRLGYTLIGRDALSEGFTLTESSFSSLDENWEPVWGEEAVIRNHYNELLVCLQQASGVAMNIRFRLYDDGLGFRYEFPQENELTYFKVES